MDRFLKPRMLAQALGLALTCTVLSPAQAAESCRDVSTHVRMFINQIVFVLAGTAEGDLRGAVEFFGDPASDQILRPSLANPSSSFAGDLRVVTRDGVLHTRSVGIFESIFDGGGTTVERVIDGTGIYSGATGTLNLNFDINDDFSVLSGELAGRLCTDSSSAR